jgi:hypothetical protein
MAEDFEGDFPSGSWTVYDAQPEDGEYYWVKRDCQSFTGDYSGWAVGGGADGSMLSCGATDPNNGESWMVYGPFSLVGAIDGELRFRLFQPDPPDRVRHRASTDGLNWSGEVYVGQTGGWEDLALDLSAVDTLGDLTGEPEVWIAFTFEGGNDAGGGGAYVDDIMLLKYTGPEDCEIVLDGQPPDNENIVMTWDQKLPPGMLITLAIEAEDPVTAAGPGPRRFDFFCSRGDNRPDGSFVGFALSCRC